MTSLSNRKRNGILGIFSSALLGMAVNAFAADNAFTVNEIRVEGLQRIEQGTVFNDLSVKVGDKLDQASSSKLIHDLFQSGFFSDVALARDGNTLVVQVVERPSIGKMEISGNKDVATEDLSKALEGVGIAEGRTFDQSILSRVEQELLQQYYNRGKYAVRVNTEVKTLERNRVSVVIDISEGVVAKIHKINLIGNKYFSDNELLSSLNLTTPGWFTWFTKNDQYSKEKLSGDIEILRSFYMDKGFINFDIESTQVSITPDKKDIYITINIKEGGQYKVAGVDFSGQPLIPKSELQLLNKLETGELYSRRRATETGTAIADRLGDDGYAFARINPVPEVNEADHTVKINFYIDPGPKVYVRNINFYGNQVTDSEVLRRELRQMEAAPVSTSAISQSRTNLMRLGFFSDANIETKPVAGTNDQVDLDIKVEEQSSGEFKGGVGFSQIDGFLFNLGVKQTNFLGTGKLVDFDFNRSAALTTYNMGYNNPYYTIDGVSRGFNMFYQESDLSELNVTNFIRDRKGLGMHFGVPVTETDRFTVGFNFERTDIKAEPDTIGNDANPDAPSTEVRNFLNKEGSAFNLFKTSLSWNHNALDRLVFPTSGFAGGVRLEATMPGSSLTYYQVSSNASLYLPLYKDDLVLSLRSNLAYGDGYAGTNELPLFENYYAGGFGTVRGFRGNSLGPKDSKNESLGGNFLATGTAELIFPVPFLDTKSVRTSIFTDVGNVFTTYDGERNSEDNSGARASFGATVQWHSPIGPFIFSLAKPIRQKDNDDTESFQFTIGTVF